MFKIDFILEGEYVNKGKLRTIAKTGGYLTSISGIKVMALWFVFLSHNSITLFNLNPASRCVELFFVISGFLSLYSFKEKENNYGYSDSLHILESRLVKILPLYLITFLYYFVVSRTKLSISIINLFMLQSWSNNPDVYFSLNGPSWYISTLLFCSFFIPFFVKIIRKLKHPYIFGLVIILFRCFVEYILTQEDKIISMNVHVSPIIRVFDFFLGMLTAYVFFMRKELHKSNVIVFSILEIIVVSLLFISDQLWGKNLYRTFFVFLSCLLCYVFAYNCGVISKVLSCGLFKFFSGIQLEFYLLHTAITSAFNIISNKFFPNLLANNYLKTVICFFIIIIVSVLYKKFFKKYFENLTMKSFAFGKKFFSCN